MSNVTSLPSREASMAAHPAGKKNSFRERKRSTFIVRYDAILTVILAFIVGIVLGMGLQWQITQAVTPEPAQQEKVTSSEVIPPCTDEVAEAGGICQGPLVEDPAEAVDSAPVEATPVEKELLSPEAKDILQEEAAAPVPVPTAPSEHPRVQGDPYWDPDGDGMVIYEDGSWSDLITGSSGCLEGMLCDDTGRYSVYPTEAEATATGLVCWGNLLGSWTCLNATS